ncbi:copper chaperone PCu(A)C [Streptomyces sp. NPDC002328]|uniref:copper chaperone PCu(A)C n=1 Tax=Streptomyces sp. NPDC002328 TaxID=3364642 RepID=UPI0036A00487
MKRFAPRYKRFAAPAAAALTGALVLAGCGSGSGPAELSVSAAYMPQPFSDSMAAGFLTITNQGGAKDELTSVTSDLAGSVTVHETVSGAMQEVDSLDVPAHGRLVLASGGNHLMFEKLKRKPTQGEKVTLKLHFAESGTVEVEMPVESATYTPKTGH